MKPLTKTAELEMLRECIARLGPDSYAGPVLSYLLPQIEADMRSDIIPEIDLRAMHRECMEAREKAKAERENIVANGQREAERIIKGAEQYSERLKQVLIERLADCAEIVRGTAHVERSPFFRGAAK
jgi:hypothetical protein